MHNFLALDKFFARYAAPLQLQWQLGEAHASAQRLAVTTPPRPWIHYARLSASPCIHVVTPDHRTRLPALIEQWQAQPALAPTLLILTEGLTLTDTLLTAHSPIPAMMTSQAASHALIRTLSYELATTLSTCSSEHGVFMSIRGVGVLLRGRSGIGKSELALALIQRGHQLIVDDAPLFYRSGNARLSGVCPSVLADFLEVRDLGILNIRRQYGDAALAPCQELDLIIELTESKQFEPRRLTPLQNCRTMGDIEVMHVQLSVKPGRDLPLLVEALVGLHQLQQAGYCASDDFINRQQQMIEQQLA
jgi:HPr kinase/phosphorylase